MERRGEVWSADAEEDAHGLADLGLERMQLRQRADRAVEDEVFGMLAQELLDAEFGAAVLAVRNVRVDLALHHVELAVDRRQSFLGLDQDETVHSVRNVLGHHWRRAVIDVEAGHQRLPSHRFFYAG